MNNGFFAGAGIMALNALIFFGLGRGTAPSPVPAATFSSIAPTLGGIMDEPIHMPDPDLTPGEAHADMKPAELAAYVKTPRKVSDSMKQKVFEAYGIVKHRPGEFEVDHLIPRELGGKDTLANLWPQSYHGQLNAHDKDRLENFLHAQVVKGKLSLKEAQEDMADNWV